MGIKLRQAPSGQELVGTAPNQVCAWDNAAKRWIAQTVSSATLTNLSNTFYYDANTTVAPGSQDGNIETPYGSGNFQTALDQLVDGSTLIIVSTDGTETGTYTVGFASITLTSLGLGPQNLPSFAQLDLFNHCEVTIQGLHVDLVNLNLCRVFPICSSIGQISDTAGSTIWGWAPQARSADDATEHYALGNISAAHIHLYGYELAGNVTATDPVKDVVLFGCEPSLNGSTLNIAGTLVTDTVTINFANQNNVTVTAADIVLQDRINSNAQYWASNQNNTANAGASTNFVAIATNNFTEGVSSDAWTFTAAGCVATYKGPAGIKWRVRTILSAQIDNTYTTGWVVANDFNGDIIGQASANYFLNGAQMINAQTVANIASNVVSERIITPTTGQTIQPAIGVPGGEVIGANRIARLNFIIEPVA